MTTPSAADLRLRIYRKIRTLFVDLLGEGAGQRSQDQISADEEIADELCADLLESIGLSVVSADEDGSMLVRLTFTD